VAAALNIAALARRTGVAPDTLRKWEQRYGILNPGRTAGGQRRYSDLDVARVEWLRDRLTEGYRIGEAAALLAAAPEATTTPEQLREAILRAGEEGDVAALEGLLERAFGLHAADVAFGEILAPVLVRVGAAWETGQLTVGQEHLISGAVRARLERLLADARGDVRGVAVLACAPGERHELGLMMLAVLLRADGWQAAYLGPDTPLADTIELAERLSASVVAISVSMAERLEAIEGLTLPPRTRLLLGGAAVSQEVARRHGALDVEEDLARAVRNVRNPAA
jgi:methanogenic corrinoid protein MtbC1